MKVKISLICGIAIVLVALWGIPAGERAVKKDGIGIAEENDDLRDSSGEQIVNCFDAEKNGRSYPKTASVPFPL